MDEVLERLLDGEPVSGQALSEELGVTRAAVWKQIEQLRAQGFVIESEGRQGYRLTQQPDSLLTPVIAGNFLFLGLVGSGLCYVLWNKAFRLLGVVATNNFIYLTPFVTIVTARLFLDESISALALLGAVLITIGVVASQWEPKKVAKSE